MDRDQLPVFWGTAGNRREVGMGRVDGEYLVVRIRDKGILNWLKGGCVGNVSIGQPQEEGTI